MAGTFSLSEPTIAPPLTIGRRPPWGGGGGLGRGVLVGLMGGRFGFFSRGCIFIVFGRLGHFLGGCIFIIFGCSDNFLGGCICIIFGRFCQFRVAAFFLFSAVFSSFRRLQFGAVCVALCA